MSKRNRKGGLQPGDLDLWLHATRGIEPLKRRKIDADPLPAKPTGSRPGTEARPAREVHVRPSAPPPPLTHGNTAGLDGRKAERLRRGKLPIEATLDLHGMTQSQAHPSLNRFIERMAAQGRRCVLIVTGKGTGKGRLPEEIGVLRRQVPLWLNQAPNRDKILSFDFAQPKHGGSGALYVLLKRNRL